MILDALMGVAVGMLLPILSVVPEWAPDPAVLGARAESIGEAAAAVNGYFPLATLALALSVVWGLRLAMSVYRLGTRLWELLPFN